MLFDLFYTALTEMYLIYSKLNNGNSAKRWKSEPNESLMGGKYLSAPIANSQFIP